jgi:hypothetical protein
MHGAAHRWIAFTTRPNKLLQQPALQGRVHRLGAADGAKLAENLAHMGLGGAFGHLKLARDLLVADAHTQQLQDIGFARSRWVVTNARRLRRVR